MKKLFFHFVVATVFCTWGKTLSVPMFPDEHWWGVCNSFGTNMPFTVETRDFNADLFAWNYGGQPASLLLSDQGRVVWCSEQTRVVIDGGVIVMESDGADVTLEQGGANLREAYAYASARHFSPSGKMPDPIFFSAPQYNTWMELTYNQNEKGIIDYAQSMLDHGLPPGVLMIDDTWQYNYGIWEFDPRKFADPKGMCGKLHAMGGYNSRGNIANRQAGIAYGGQGIKILLGRQLMVYPRTGLVNNVMKSLLA